MRAISLVSLVLLPAICGSAQTYFGATNGSAPALRNSAEPYAWTTAPPPADSVTLRQLAARPSAHALRDIRKASRLSVLGEHAKAVVLLEHAVRDSPDYYEAHNDLGIEYNAADRVAEAEAEFRKLLALDPSCAVGCANLGVLIYNAGHYRESEQIARRAMQRQAGYDLAEFLLAMSLVQQNRELNQARRLLFAASRTIPEATAALQTLEVTAASAHTH